LIPLFLYGLVVVAVTLLQKHRAKLPVFKSSTKVSWVLSGLSLYMLFLSVDQGQLLTGIIAEHGMQGLWMLWAGCLGIFVVPLVFAPLWQKLDFLTDNQFLLFRFPGRSGKILHLFRALYVGGLVVSLSLCFHVLGFSRVLQTFYHINPQVALWITGGLLCLFALKNIFEIKLKLDALHAVIYFVSFGIILYGLWNTHNGWHGLFTFFVQHPEKKQLLPSSSDTSAWFSLLVFVGVQWWSCYLFDGGGPEMARYTAVKNKHHAVLTGLLPVLISFVLSFFLVGHSLWILGSVDFQEKAEIQYIERVVTVVPEAFKSFVLIGFFGMFITTAESLLHWGASFLTLDGFKTYVQPKASEKRIRFLSFVSMVFLACLSVVFAGYIDSLQSLVKFTFSIAAGVAPVYILRWVWFRINAWSQLSAMLSSAVFTLLYPQFHAFTPLKPFPMEEARIVAVTLLTSIVWLLVTWLSPDQRVEVQQRMLPIVESRSQFLRRLLLAVGLGVILLCLTAGSWYWITQT